MIYLDLDPTPRPFGALVALSADASITSLGEARLGSRRFQVRRTTAVADGRTRVYLLDARGRAYYLEAAGDAYYATSRDSGQDLTHQGAPARFRFVNGRVYGVDPS